MRSIPLSIMLVLGLLSTSGGARGQSPDTTVATASPGERSTPSVDELVARALAAAPSLAAARARVEAARQREAPAGALPDPTLEIMIQDAGFPDWTVGDMEMSMIGPQINQGIPFPGKQGARKAAAAAVSQVRARELESLARRIGLEVRLTYAELYRIDQELALLQASRDLVDVLSAVVVHHVETADMDPEAALKTRILRSRLEESRVDLEAERVAQVARLNRWLDQPADTPMDQVTLLPSAEPSEGAQDSLAREASPEVRVREALVDAAGRQLEAARREARPDFMLGAGVGFRGDLDPVVSLRLGVELPLWSGRKQRPLIRAAQAEMDVARHELRDAQAAAGSDEAALRAEWNRAREQVVRYEESFVPQSYLALEAARSAYLGARADFSTVIEDFDLWLDARRGLARRESERFAVWARLDALLSVTAVPAATEGDRP